MENNIQKSQPGPNNVTAPPRSHRILITVDRTVEAIVTILLIPALAGIIAMFAVPILQGRPVLEASVSIAALFWIIRPLLLVLIITKVWRAFARTSCEDAERYTPKWTRAVRKVVLPVALTFLVFVIGGLAYVFQGG